MERMQNQEFNPNNRALVVAANGMPQLWPYFDGVELMAKRMGARSITVYETSTDAARELDRLIEESVKHS